MIVIDGNDGTGKTTVANELAKHGIKARDRGLATKMTDDPGLADNGDTVFVLHAPVPVCRQRLARRGADLDERYHTENDLKLYGRLFLELRHRIGNIHFVDADRAVDEIVREILDILGK